MNISTPAGAVSCRMKLSTRAPGTWSSTRSRISIALAAASSAPVIPMTTPPTSLLCETPVACTLRTIGKAIPEA